MNFLELAYEILKKAEKPLTYQEIWDSGESMGLAQNLGSLGKTPWQSLGARLYVDVRDNAVSKFIKVGKRPARFFLAERGKEVAETLAAKAEIGEQKPLKKFSYKERSLHPALTYFAYATPSFNRGREVLTKTINHQNAKKGGYSEWTYPDLVGFSIPIEDWHSEVFQLNELLGRDALTLFSFEVKRELAKANYREAFFQAVSNSSWAHHGFLVAAEIANDDDLLAELERLSASFGIGIIDLRLPEFSEAQVLYPARAKTDLDWETINKLCDENGDFENFLKSVRIDVNARKIHHAEYDPIEKDIEGYIKRILQGTAPFDPER